jgi:PTH1 family peptidyl-tRNA hydrolase
MTKLIVGLGNPDKEYQNTRHNLGFLALDHFKNTIDASNFSLKSAFQAEISEGKVGETKVLLAKPSTFMNLSGQAVRKIADYYHLSFDDIIIIYDDIDLLLGQSRIRTGDQTTTHNGVRSVIEHLNDNQFIRVRIGIDHIGRKLSTERFVLGKFNVLERKNIDQMLELVVKELIVMLETKTIVSKTVSL